jgi:hypothetical protein
MKTPEELNAMMALADALGLDTEHLGGILDYARGPSKSELIQSFIDVDWEGFRMELDGLSSQPVLIPRILVFGQSVDFGFDFEFDEDPDAEEVRVSWSLKGVEYAPSDYLHGNLDELRTFLDAAMSRRAQDSDTIAVWIFTSKVGPFDQNVLTLFVRDKAGLEELYVYAGGPLIRHPCKPDDFGEELRKVEPVFGTPDERRLARALSAHGALAELAGNLSELADPSADATCKAITAWLERSPLARNAIEGLVRERTNPVQDEAQIWLRTSTRDVAYFMNEVREENSKGLQEVERQKEKRMKGLRADNEKMQMLTNGVRARADKTDADNRNLRRRVTDLEAKLAVSAGGAPAAEMCTEESAIQRALDTYFS